MTTKRQGGRRFLQFSLRTLVLMLTLLALWLAMHANTIRREREAIRVFKQLGAAFLYDYQFDASGRLRPNANVPAPSWLRRAIGDEYFVEVVELTLPYKAQPSASDLREVKQFRNLRALRLSRGLGGGGARITDEGLENLGRLSQLRELDLGLTAVGDQTLRRITSLSNLEVRDLTGTKVTDEGVKYLTRLPKLRVLSLWGTSVTDRGLANLGKIQSLRQISLDRTMVTLRGVEQLEDAIPSVSVQYTIDAQGIPVR